VEILINHDLVLSFLTDRNNNLVMRIPRVYPDLTDDDVKDAMLGIINSNAVSSSRGTPLFRVDAEMITTTTTDFDIFTS
jgi:hypothetical protein